MLLFILAGCGSSDDLSRAEAAKVVQTATLFKQEASITLHPSINEVLTEKLRNAGYFISTPDGKYELTAKGKAQWPHVKDCSQFQILCWDLTIGTKKLIEVTGVSHEPKSNDAEVEFTWQWEANDAGRFLKLNTEKISKCKIGLQKFDDGWRDADVAEGDCGGYTTNFQ